MEILMTAVSTVGSMFSAGAGAAGATAGGLGGLSGTFSAVSSMASMGSGLMGLFSGMSNASNQRFMGEVDQLQSDQRIVDLAEERNRVIANNMVMAASSGLDITAGEPAWAAAEAERDTERAMKMERENAALRRYQRNRMAQAAEISGWSSLVTGMGSAAKEMTTSGLRSARRGMPEAA